MEDPSSPSSLRSPSSLVDVFWRHKALIAGLTLVGGLLGYLLASMQPTTYRSSARLLLKDPRSTSTLFEEARQPGIDNAARFARNRAQVLNSAAVRQRAAELLGGRFTPGQIAGKVTVEPAKEADLLTVSATDSTARGAADLANALGTAFREISLQENRAKADATAAEMSRLSAVLRERIRGLEGAVGSSRTGGADDGYNTQRTTAVTQLLNLEGRADAVLVDASLYGDGVSLLDRAQVPAAPAAPHPLGAATVGAFLAFLAAAALAWWLAEHRQAADDRQDPAEILGAPLLAEIPDFASSGVAGVLPARDAPNSVVGEAYHFLVTSLGFSLLAHGGNTIVITSAGPADGKTVTAVNLGIAAARDGRRVLLVDGDERQRGLTSLTGVPTEPGLTDLTGESVPLSYVASAMELPGAAQLPVVPAGGRSPDGPGFFRTPSFRAAMTRLKEAGDLIIIDSPPLLAVSDTSALAAQADGIVLVVRRGTPLRALRDLRERLAFVGAPVLGYVFTRTDPRASRSSYSYGYSAQVPGSGGLLRLSPRRNRSRETV